MLLFLPAELIEEVVRHAIPSKYCSSAYDERQDILRTICLISRRLKEVAQPILQEVMQVSHRETVEDVKVLFEHDLPRRRTRILSLSTEVDLQSFAAGCAALRDLHIYDFIDLDLPLQHLVLCSCKVKDVVCRLPSLTSLTWSDSSAVDDQQLSFLQPVYFPKLRNLAYWDADHAPNQELRLSLSPALLLQLDTLVTAYQINGVPLSSRWPLVLVEMPVEGAADLSFAEPFRLGARFLPFYKMPAPHLMQQELVVATLETLASYLTKPHSIELFYLPADCKPSPFQDEEMASAVGNLLALCRAQGIAVDFEDMDETGEGSLIAPRFSSHARKLRREEAEKEGGTVGSAKKQW
ncbi:hypothetical protein JCM11251_004834 [Rhodosporidiobolus azoricus]